MYTVHALQLLGFQIGWSMCFEAGAPVMQPSRTAVTLYLHMFKDGRDEDLPKLHQR